MGKVMFKHNYSILLVDDENCARQLLGERISKIPDVTLAASVTNGISAQKYLREHVVDMVFTDVNMPLMDGLELAAFTREFAPFCPVVIISGYEEFEYARKAIQYGVKEYLLKPVTFGLIVETIEKCCKEIDKRRAELLLPQYNPYEELEQQIYKSFVKGDDSESWIGQVNQLLTQKGTIVRIEPESPIERKRDELSIIYKNILMDVLPGQIVLRLGHTQDKYEYLIVTNNPESHRQVKVIPEYLERILKQPVKWTEVCEVFSAQELASLSKKASTDEGNGQIEAACRYMQANLGKMITRDEVAGAVWLSPSYFSHLFKQTMGVGYNEYLTDIRIKQAKKMLLQNVSISDIAVSVGFRDARYFSNIFQQKTGYTPSEYRRALLNEEISQED